MHEDPRHQPWVLGRPSSWQWQLEKHSPQTTNAGQRKADSGGRQAASSQKGSHHQTWNHTQMQPLQQRLSLRLACLITDNTAQADSLDRSTHGWPWPTWAYYCYYLKFMACCTYLNSITMVNININIQNTWMIPVQNEKPILFVTNMIHKHKQHAY